MDLVSMRMILPNWLVTMSSLVSSTRLMPVTFPILRAVFKTEFPKWESFKNKSGKVACFSSPKNDHQLTTFSPAIHHKFTTKNHVLIPVFAKTPSKNEIPPSPRKILRNISSSAGFGPFSVRRSSSPQSFRRANPGSRAERIAAPDMGFSLSHVSLTISPERRDSPDSAGIQAIALSISCLI
jgi:hypothetical protein